MRFLTSLALNRPKPLSCFFRQVKETRSIPFDIKLPNKDTLDTLEKVKQGKGLTVCKNADELFDKFGI
ncbi:MAG: type II toxin-antitoxin system RelB/DinJ family antitoxin [Moraxella sp.]|nr:type II toxin-antitoxin system RelB/DinJ family antitoxin [Moraxella sp.]